jgi:hypothetical protein
VHAILICLGCPNHLEYIFKAFTISLCVIILPAFCVPDSNKHSVFAMFRPDETPPACHETQTVPLTHMTEHLHTHSDLGLSEGWRYVKIFRYPHMTEVVSVLDAPDSQPVYVVHSQVPRQLYFDVLPLVPSEWLKAETGTWRSAAKFLLSEQTERTARCMAFTCRCCDLPSPE